ncbi:MAG: TnpV protein [Christensenellales bacterium]
MTNELTYTKNGEYWIPDLTAAEQPMELSKYGRMREWFLKEHRTITYNNLLLSGKLTAHLMEIDRAAVNRMEEIMPELAKRAGATEALKATNPMRWVGLMNTCKAQAEEIVMNELIYA